MAKGFGDRLASLMLADRANSRIEQHATLNDIDGIYEMAEPFALGTHEKGSTARRQRKDIYTTWQQMQADPSIAEGLSLHVAAALGGHESRGEVVFMTPNERIRGDGKHNAMMRQKVERRKRHLEPIVNRIIAKVCRDAVAFGDGYVRVYGQKGRGITDVICNEYTHPPLIQAFEQGGRTIGYHALEDKDWIRVVTKLSTVQMLRMKMQRVTHVPQFETVQGLVRKQILKANIQSDLPIVPAHVGGSFLYEVEEPWQNVHLTLAGMNSQQIADAVNQMFLTINMSGMPPEQQKKYRAGLEKVIKSHETHVRDALSGGDAIWATKYHVLPTYDDKQILNPVGDIKGQRTSPINTEVFMINVRRLMGGMGMDVSMVGWADMLAGGLGDGAAFHTSSQIMRRSVLIRQAASDLLNQLAALDWGYAFDEVFDPVDYPWQFEFYSDQSAAATEMLTNKQTRMNTLALTAQAFLAVKELGLDQESTAQLLEDVGGMDYEKAKTMSESITRAPPPEGQEGGGQGGDDDQEVEPSLLDEEE